MSLDTRGVQIPNGSKNPDDEHPDVGVYLTVTSIGVCDGGECSTLLKPYNM